MSAQVTTVMFEPDAESMPPDLLAAVQEDRLRGLVDRLLAVDREDVVAVHGSSGTGGRPTLVSYTRDDLRLWARMCARALAAAGATPASIVHNAYGYGLFTGGIGIHQGAQPDLLQGRQPLSGHRLRTGLEHGPPPLTPPDGTAPTD